MYTEWFIFRTDLTLFHLPVNLKQTETLTSRCHCVRTQITSPPVGTMNRTTFNYNYQENLLFSYLTVMIMISLMSSTFRPWRMSTAATRPLRWSQWVKVQAQGFFFPTWESLDQVLTLQQLQPSHLCSWASCGLKQPCLPFIAAGVCFRGKCSSAGEKNEKKMKTWMEHRQIIKCLLFFYHLKICKFLQRSPGRESGPQMFHPQRLWGNSFLLLSPASSQGLQTSEFWTEFRFSFPAWPGTLSALGTGWEGLPSPGLGQLLGEERTTQRCRWGGGPCALHLQQRWPSPPACLHFATSPFPEQSLFSPGFDKQRRALWIHSRAQTRKGRREDWKGGGGGW